MAPAAAGEHRPAASQLPEIEILERFLERSDLRLQDDFVRVAPKIRGDGGIAATLHRGLNAVALQIKINFHGGSPVPVPKDLAVAADNSTKGAAKPRQYDQVGSLASLAEAS